MKSLAESLGRVTTIIVIIALSVIVMVTKLADMIRMNQDLNPVSLDLRCCSDTGRIRRGGGQDVDL